MNYYKVTDLNGNAIHGGTFCYDLPSNAVHGKAGVKSKKTSTPGMWTPDEDPVIMCQAGYHVTDAAGLELWRARQRIGSERITRAWLVQVRGLKRDKNSDDEHKYVARQIRLLREVNPFVVPANANTQLDHQAVLTSAERRKIAQIEARLRAAQRAFKKADRALSAAHKQRVRNACAKLMREWDHKLTEK